MNISRLRSSCSVWDGNNASSNNSKVAVTLFFVVFVLPLVVLIFPFIALAMQVFGCREPRLDPPHSRTALTGTILAVIYIISLGPYQIFEAMQIFNTAFGTKFKMVPVNSHHAAWDVDTELILNAMVYIACIIHPIVYFVVNPDYRAGLANAWKNLYCNKDPVQVEKSKCLSDT